MPRTPRSGQPALAVDLPTKTGQDEAQSLQHITISMRFWNPRTKVCGTVRGSSVHLTFNSTDDMREFLRTIADIARKRGCYRGH